MAKIKLVDQVLYPVQDVTVPEPIAPVQIWGDRVFLIQKNGAFKEVPFNVIQDTSDSGRYKL